jgi:hypothetical protein
MLRRRISRRRRADARASHIQGKPLSAHHLVGGKLIGTEVGGAEARFVAKMLDKDPSLSFAFPESILKSAAVERAADEKHIALYVVA